MPSTDVALEVFYDGAWHDLVTSDQVLAEQTITITRGDGAESAAPRPASLTARLNNADDSLRITNPESPLYGRAGRNAPVRVSVDGTVRAATEATSWASGQTREFRVQPRRGKAWVDLESGGLLQRVNNWTEPLRSAISRYTNRITDQLGHWPLEDGRDAAGLSNLTPLGIAGTHTGDVDLGDETVFGGGSSTAKFTSAAASMSGAFAVSSASGWQVSLCVKLPSVPAGAAQELFRVVDGAGRSWVLKISGTGYDFDCTSSAGTLLQSVNTVHSVDPASWVRFTLKVSISGGTITMRQQRYEEQGAGIFADEATFAGTTTSQPRTWVIPGNSYTSGANFASVLGVSQATADLMFNDADFLASFEGYRGELARNRFARIMIEELGSSSWSTVGTSALSAPMGPQKPATLAELLREIRDTEDGLIYDSRTSVRLVFRLRNARYNQVAVSISVNDLPMAPEDISDDLGLHNSITVTNRSGESSVAIDATGPLGTAAAPDGVGEYQQDIDVNVDDVTDLPQHANWWLKRGTVDLPRYPKVTVNLSVLDPAKRAEIEDLDIGEVLEITGYRENTIRLFVIGYTETIPWGGSRRITFTCAPDQQFDVGTYGASTTQRRYDMRTATVKTAAGRADTTLTLKCTDDEAWSNASTYDVMIAGERVTFVAGQVGARTGTLGDYEQIVTNVVRSVNGVRKALPVGSAVHVAEQGRWAL